MIAGGIEPARIAAQILPLESLCDDPSGTGPIGSALDPQRYRAVPTASHRRDRVERIETLRRSADNALDRPSPQLAYARYAGVGLQFAATIGLFAYGGWALDDALGTTPWFLIVGVFLGATGGFIKLVTTFMPRRAPGESGSRPDDRQGTSRDDRNDSASP